MATRWKPTNNLVKAHKWKALNNWGGVLLKTNQHWGHRSTKTNQPLFPDVFHPRKCTEILLAQRADPNRRTVFGIFSVFFLGLWRTSWPWAVLIVMSKHEQMSNGWPFPLLNEEEMSKKVRVEHQPGPHECGTTPLTPQRHEYLFCKEFGWESGHTWPSMFVRFRWIPKGIRSTRPEELCWCNTIELRMHVQPRACTCQASVGCQSVSNQTGQAFPSNVSDLLHILGCPPSQ